MTSLETAAREILVIDSRPGAPFACDMTGAPDTPQDRLAEYGRLFAHALVGRERRSDSVEFRFASKVGVAEWVADLARREAACCPFFSYRVTADGDHVIWRTGSDGGAEAQVMLDELHELPDHCAEGIDGYFARLAQRGVSITSPAPRQFRIQQFDPARSQALPGKKSSGCGC